MAEPLNPLQRPGPGDKNTVTLNTGVRFVRIISRKFICKACRMFCGELIPVLDGKTREWMRRTSRTLTSPELQVKVFCYSGCHEKMHWGWDVFTWSKTEINAISAWPKEWTGDRGAQELERVVREEQAKRYGG